MWGLGWQVFRARLPDVVSVRDRRRLVVVGSVVAVVGLVGFLVLAGSQGWDPALAVAAFPWSVGLGCFALVFCRVGPRGWSIPAVPSIGWRTQEQVARYYGRRPPAVTPEHRDVVLHGIEADRDRLVRASLQGIFLALAWVFAVVGAVVVWAAASWTHGPVFLYAPLWPLIAGGSSVFAVRTLGRQEQLRVEASALPDPPAVRPARGRPGTPGGSKLALPGE